MRKKLYPKKQNHTSRVCRSCGLDVYKSSTFEAVIDAARSDGFQGGFTAYRTTPVRSLELVADVAVPAAQALITSVVTTIPAIAVAMIFRWEYYTPAAVGAVSIMVSWFKALSDAKEGASVVEQYTWEDDRVGESEIAGRPEEAPIRLEVVSRDDDYKASMRIVDLPADVDGAQFVSFCKDILSGKSLARASWVGSGKEFSRDTYDGLMLSMEQAGLIMSIPGKGRKITNGGRRAMEQMMRQA